MYRKYRFDRLQFNDQSLVDQDIQTKALLKFNPRVRDSDWLLAFD